MNEPDVPLSRRTFLAAGMALPLAAQQSQDASLPMLDADMRKLGRLRLALTASPTPCHPEDLLRIGHRVVGRRVHRGQNDGPLRLGRRQRVTDADALVGAEGQINEPDWRCCRGDLPLVGHDVDPAVGNPLDFLRGCVPAVRHADRRPELSQSAGDPLLGQRPLLRSLPGLGLPVRGEFNLHDLQRAWMRDKKYRHGIRFVVLNALGRPESGVTADEATLEQALSDLAKSKSLHRTDPA